MDDDLTKKAARIAHLAAVPDDAVPPEGELPENVTPIGRSAAGGPTPDYIDIVFDDANLFSHLEDGNGNEVKLGRWITNPTGTRLRVPLRLTIEPMGSEAPTHRDAKRTENIAAYKIAPHAGSGRERVLRALWADHCAGGRGMTHEQMGEITGLGQYTAGPRCTQLVKGEWVEDSGHHGTTKRGNPAILWRLTPQAIEKLEASWGTK